MQFYNQSYPNPKIFYFHHFLFLPSKKINHLLHVGSFLGLTLHPNSRHIELFFHKVPFYQPAMWTFLCLLEAWPTVIILLSPPGSFSMGFLPLKGHEWFHSYFIAIVMYLQASSTNLCLGHCLCSIFFWYSLQNMDKIK